MAHTPPQVPGFKFEVIVLQDGRVGVNAPIELLKEKFALIGMLEYAKKSVMDFVPPVVAVPTLGEVQALKAQELNGNDPTHPPLRRI